MSYCENEGACKCFLTCQYTSQRPAITKCINWLGQAELDIAPCTAQQKSAHGMGIARNQTFAPFRLLSVASVAALGILFALFS